MLSSSYSEYAQLNRSATQDFQTLEMQRAKITNSLLSYLDELSPEELAQVDVPPKAIHYAEPVAQTPKTTSINPKMYMYAAGALLLLVIAYFIFSKSDSAEPEFIQNTTSQSAVVEQNTTKSNGNNSSINGKNVGLVEFNAGQGKLGTYDNDGNSWVEEANGRSFRFREVNRDDWSVYLRDDSRGVNIQLDLYAKQVKYSDDKGAAFVMAKITHVD